MNWIIYLFGSGAAFFLGVALVFAGVTLAAFTRRSWSLAAASCAAIVGLILIGLSATPLPYWFYGVAGAVSVAWLIAERSGRPAFQHRLACFRVAIIAVWVAGTLAELPYHWVPNLGIKGSPKLYIIGDSVATGMGDAAVQTWPRLLARTHSVEVHDLSQMGEKVRTALRNVERKPPGEGIILLEIGGNDLLGGTPVGDFERDLDALLARVGGPGRVVVMFELPLPPGDNEFGRAQRRLAGKHGVRLIPKRVLVRVLTADGATVDSVHLSRPGHELMAEAVWGVIGPAYSPSNRR